jgi:hypothetical protein
MCSVTKLGSGTLNLRFRAAKLRCVIAKLACLPAAMFSPRLDFMPGTLWDSLLSDDGNGKDLRTMPSVAESYQ